jgi:hypothetical protein
MPVLCEVLGDPVDTLPVVIALIIVCVGIVCIVGVIAFKCTIESDVFAL